MPLVLLKQKSLRDPFLSIVGISLLFEFTIARICLLAAPFHTIEENDQISFSRLFFDFKSLFYHLITFRNQTWDLCQTYSRIPLCWIIWELIVYLHWNRLFHRRHYCRAIFRLLFISSFIGALIGAFEGPLNVINDLVFPETESNSPYVDFSLVSECLIDISDSFWGLVRVWLINSYLWVWNCSIIFMFGYRSFGYSAHRFANRRKCEDNIFLTEVKLNRF